MDKVVNHNVKKKEVYDRWLPLKGTQAMTDILPLFSLSCCGYWKQYHDYTGHSDSDERGGAVTLEFGYSHVRFLLKSSRQVKRPLLKVGIEVIRVMAILFNLLV